MGEEGRGCTLYAEQCCQEHSAQRKDMTITRTVTNGLLFVVGAGRGYTALSR